MKPIRYFANLQLVARVQQATGLTKRESQVAVIATTMAIVEQLMEGQDVALQNLGTFYFRMVSGKVIPEHGAFPRVVLKARPMLKFKVSEKLRKQLIGILPEVVRPMRIRKIPGSTPSPSPKPADSASPSNQASEGGALLI